MKKDKRNKVLTEFSAWRHVIDLTPASQYSANNSKDVFFPPLLPNFCSSYGLYMSHRMAGGKVWMLFMFVCFVFYFFYFGSEGKNQTGMKSTWTCQTTKPMVSSHKYLPSARHNNRGLLDLSRFSRDEGLRNSPEISLPWSFQKLQKSGQNEVIR